MRLGGLYVIIDPAACKGRDPVQVARQAVEGGASMLQWRDKTREKGLQLPDVLAVFDIARRADVPLIVNDHADLALAIEASLRFIRVARGPILARARGLIGVHVGQKDLPVAEVRHMLPASYIVGSSTNNVEEARRAEAEGADYIAVGDIFGTSTKEGTRGASPELLAQVKRRVRKPVIAIGGIHAANLRQVLDAGADGAAVISAVCGAVDPRAAAEELAGMMRR